MLIGERGGRHCPNISKLKVGQKTAMLQEKWSRCIQDIRPILLLLVVGQIFKTPLPLQRKVSQHISARKQLTSFGIAMQNNVGSLLGGSLFASRLVKVQGRKSNFSYVIHGRPATEVTSTFICMR